MKKIFALLFALVLTFSFASCGDLGDESNNSESGKKDAVLVYDAKNVKIYYTGISADLGVGEGLAFSVENSRSESIIVNMSDASYNDTMSAVIQPQMPLNIISSGKKSTQAFVFSNQKFSGGKVQFKFRILNEDYNELFTTDFLEITL